LLAGYSEEILMPVHRQVVDSGRMNAVVGWFTRGCGVFRRDYEAEAPSGEMGRLGSDLLPGSSDL
jgi:hypothetical protein